MLSPDEHVAFDMYFASVVSMQYHPGAGTKEHQKMPLQDCADVALEMIAIRRAILADRRVS